VAGAVLAAGAGALAWGVAVERNRFGVRRERLAILPPGSRPIRILHLSDLHMAPWQTAKQRFVRGLANLEPDLIVETGDVLGHRDGLVGVRRAFARFRGIPGVFVSGSNDVFGPTAKNPLAYFTGPSRRRDRSERLDYLGLAAHLSEGLGWHDLNNGGVALDIAGTRLEIVGTGDAHRDWDRLEDVAEIADGLRLSRPADVEAVQIGVTHAPYRRVLDSLVTNGAQLLLAGHTHGGQVRIPGLPALVANCDLPREKASGLSSWHHAGRTAALEVSAGIGTSIYAPFRFACPPEAVLLTLTPREA